MFKLFIRWLFRNHLEICEGCDGLYKAALGNETDDMVTLCPPCYKDCAEDPDCQVADELETP